MPLELCQCIKYSPGNGAKTGLCDVSLVDTFYDIVFLYWLLLLNTVTKAKDAFNWVNGSRLGIIMARKARQQVSGAGSCWSQFNCTQETERINRKWAWLSVLKACPQWCTSSSKDEPTKSSTTSPNLGPSVQTHECVWNVPPSNHHSSPDAG